MDSTLIFHPPFLTGLQTPSYELHICSIRLSKMVWGEIVLSKLLSSHCSHRKPVKCKLYIKSLVYNTSLMYNSVHSGQSVHVSSATHESLESQHKSSTSYIAPARTRKLLTGYSIKLWSVCALLTPLLRCDPCIQPEDSVVTRNTDNQRQWSGNSDFVHAPQVNQTSSYSINPRLENARCLHAESRRTEAHHKLRFTHLWKLPTFSSSS